MIHRFFPHLEVKDKGEINAPSNNFHLIRYVLALLVLYSHSFGLIVIPEPGIFTSTFGVFAVKCFFALSGYLITISCVRTANLTDFALNRFLRIVPGLIVALIMSHFISAYFNHFVSNPVQYISNGPIWTLSWEVVCYILCGFLFWFGALNINSLGSMVVISWLIFIISPSTSQTAVVIAPLILIFFTGAYIALNEEKLKLSIAGPVAVLMLCFVIYDATFSNLTADAINYFPFLYGPEYEILKYQTLIYLIALPFALIWLAKTKAIIKLKNDYSYGMYIYAWPIQQMLIAVVPTIRPLTLFFCAWAITHCVAMISWHVFEKKCLHFKR